jgi:hypothetical protein
MFTIFVLVPNMLLWSIYTKGGPTRTKWVYQFIRFIYYRVGPPFASRTAWILQGMDSTMCQKNISCSRDLTCARKTFPTPLNYHHQPVPGRMGSMDSCCLGQILTLPTTWHNRNWDSSDQAMFFHSSIVQCWWSRAHWRHFFLFLAGRKETRCGLLLQ